MFFDLPKLLPLIVCPAPPPAGASMQGVLLSSPTNHNREACRQQCHHAAAHLQQAAAHLQRVVHLYQQVQLPTGSEPLDQR